MIKNMYNKYYNSNNLKKIVLFIIQTITIVHIKYQIMVILLILLLSCINS